MKQPQLFLILFSMVLTGCSAHLLNLDAVWENPDYEQVEYKKIAVIGLVKDFKNKREFEKDAVKYFKSKGVVAIPGFEIFQTDDHVETFDSNEVKKKLFEKGFDGVLTSKVLERISQETIDTTTHSSRHANQIYRYGQYFTPRYEHLQNNIHKDYAVLESNFYLLQVENDFDGAGLLWISHYKLADESLNHLNIEIDEYAHIIVQSLFDDQIIQ